MTRFKSHCVVCGREIEDVVRQSYEGEEYHFCCEKCRMEFLGDPEKYAAKISRPESGRETRGAVKCSVCGEKVSEEVAVQQEYREEQSDEKYYFCCEKHRIEFIADPMTYKGLSGKHVSP